jgi:uncharacterized caspase-like protein
MRLKFLLFWFGFLPLFCLAQTEGVSPSYSFSIKKKMEPPLLRMIENSVLLLDENGNKAIDGKEACQIQFEVINEGYGDAKGLRLRALCLQSESDLYFEADQAIPEIKKSASAKVSLPVRGGANVKDQMVEFMISVYEPNGFGLDEFSMRVQNWALRLPKLDVVDYTVSSKSGKLVRKEGFELNLLLQNVGQGASSAATVKLILPEHTVLLSGNSNVSIEKLAPNESKSIKYELILNQLYAESLIPIKVEMTDVSGQTYRWQQSLRLEQSTGAASVAIESQRPVETTISAGSLRSDVDKDIPQGLATNKKRYALCIGNENYSKNSAGLTPEVDVPFAINDASIFAEYAKTTLGVPTENVLLVTDATKARMSYELSKIQKWMELDKGESEVIFYYSGHGLPEEGTKTPFLIPIDVSGTRASEGLALTELYNRLNQFPAKKVTIILDACFSGGARAGELVAMKGIKVVQKMDGVPANLVVLTSSSGNEASAVYSEKQHGYFTYFLLKWLKENKAKGTVKEMMDYVGDNVAREAVRIGKSQTPQTLLGRSIANDGGKITWE